MPNTAPPYTIGGITRPEIFFDANGNIVLTPEAAAFANTYGVKALYFGLPFNTPYPPVADSLSAPSDANGAPNSVVEGAGVNTPVNLTVSASSTGGNAVTYALVSDSSGGGFKIDPTTGVVTVADPSKINFETAAGHAYSVTAQASDGILTSSQTFSIAVTDVAPSTPTDSNLAPNNVAEGAAIGTTVGVTAASTDVNGPGVTWSLTADTSHGGFTIDPVTGVVTIADPSKVDFESSSASGHTYSVTATASDGTLSNSQTFTIAVTDVAPVISSPASVAVNEGVAAHSLVYTAVAADPAGGAVTYSLSGTDAGQFTIDPATGAVTINASPDFESKASYDIVIVASDASSAFTSEAVTIHVTNLPPSVPTDSDTATANTVVEGAPSGTLVGITASSFDVNGPAVTYSLTDTANGAFKIDHTSGIVSIDDASRIDFEGSGGNINITVQASDGAGGISTHTFAIAVTDAPPASWSDADSGVNSVVEGAASGTTVGVSAQAIDPGGGHVTYSLLTNPNNAFAIDASSGVITVADSTKVDFESTAASGHTYTLTVKGADDSGQFTTNDFIIGVTDEAPGAASDTDTAAGTGGSVAEGIVGGATATPADEVGITAHADDVNGGTITYSLSNDAGGLFDIDPSTGVVFVKTGAVIDFENTAPGHAFAIAVDASDGTRSSTANFTINVTNLPPSPPTDANGAPGGTVQINAANGSPVGITLSASDPGGGAVSFAITDPSGNFAVDPNSGVVTLKAGHAPLVALETFTISATASDGTTQGLSQDFTIFVPNNELNVDLDGNDDHGSGNDYAAIYTEQNPAGTPLTDSDDVITNTGNAGVTNATSASIVLTNAQSGDALLVNGALPGGITATTTTSAGHITITLSGSASYAAYQTALHQIEFSTSGDAPNTTARVVDITVTDSTGTSPVAVATITVEAVNDGPTLVLSPAGPVSYTENAGPTALFSVASITDPDAPAEFSGGSYTVAITNPDPGGGDQIVLLGSSGFSASGTSLLFGGTAIGTIHAGTGLGTSSVTIDFNAAATPAVVNALADAFGFQNSSDDPSTTPRIVHFTFNDGNHTHTDATSVALNSNVVSQTVNVIAVNDAPTAVDDIAPNQVEDTGSPWTITGANLVANDFTGPPGVNETGQHLAVTGAGNAVGGAVSVVAGNVVFTPTADFNGAASFDYTVTDDGTTNGTADPKTATAHVTFNVSEVNDPPTATADTLTDIAEDSGPRAIAFATLTGNDSAGPANEAGQHLSVTNPTNAVGGSVAIVGGNVVFTPDANFAGAASFDYTVTDDGTTNGTADPKSSAAPGHVTFNVTEVNDAPIANADVLTPPVAEDSGARTILFTDLTGNDSPGGGADEALQTLTVTAVGNAVGGTVAIVSGHVEFTPTANFNGTATFDYTVEDNGTTNGAPDPKTAVGHASLTVTEVNDAPTAVDDTLDPVAKNSTADIFQFASLTGNDSAGPASESAQTLTVTAVDTPLHGTVAVVGGHVEFTPDAGFAGTASFHYTIQDNGTTNGLADPKTAGATASFTVADIALDLDADNSAAPGANYATVVTSLATPVAIADADTTIIDPASPTLTTAIITITASSFVSGEDELAFTPDSLTMGDIAAAAFDNTSGVLTLTSAAGASAAQWEAALHAVTYQDTGLTSSADRTVTVAVSDGTLTSNTAVTTVHFEANSPPVATDDTLTTVAEDSGLRTILFTDLTANDSAGPPNEAGQTLTVTAVSNAVGGSVAIVGGHVEFTPTADFNGAASFDYTLQDNGTTLGSPDPKTDVGHVTFTVTEVNDAPSAVADALTSVAEDSGVRTIAFTALTGNDSAGPANESTQTLTVTAVSNAVGGSVAIVAGHVEFTPTANFNGPASFDYTVQDNGTTNGASDFKSATGHASFTITEVNDAPEPVADTQAPVAEHSGYRTILFSELTGNDSPGPANESAQTLTVSAVGNAVGGTVAINAGVVEFTPTANFNGTASFDYTVQDNGTTNGVSDPKTATGHASFAVTAVNDAPVLDLNSADGSTLTGFSAAYTVSATPVAIAPATVSVTDVDDTNINSATVTLTNALANDVLAVNGVLPGGIAATTTSGAGTITVTLSGSATLAQYQAALHQIVFSNGLASPDPTAQDRTITVVVDDPHGAPSNTATTTIHLTQDTPPVANPKTASATEAGGINAGSNGSGNVITDAVADSDAENPALVVSGFAHGASTGTVGNSLAGDFGTLTLNANGTYSYAVDNANTTVQGLRQNTDTLTDSFNYTIKDTAGVTSTSTLTLTIHGANDTPVAVADTPSATEAGGVANASPGVNPSGNVLANDTDVDSIANGETKTVVGLALGTQTSAVSGNVGGAGLHGAGAQNFGTLTVAADGTYSYVVNQSNATVQGLLTASQTVTDTFSYTVQDAGGLNATTQVTVTIHGANDAPTAVADTANATEAGGTNNGTPGTNIANFNVLTGVGTGSAADTDPDTAANGETQTVQGVETGNHPTDVVTTGVGSALVGSFGTLTLNSNGSYSYTVDNTNTTVNALNTGAHVDDVFTYTMHDAAGGTSTSTTTLTIHVNGANDAPVAAADSAVVFEGNATTPAVNLLANDSDVDTPHGNLTAVGDTAPGHGSVVVHTDGTFTYTGNAGYLGADSFTYHAADNGSPNLSSASVTVTLDVQPHIAYIDNTSTGAEDGSLAHPFQSIADFNAQNTAANHFDIIYLEKGTGTYTTTTGITLLAGQTLDGQGVDATYTTSASAPGGAQTVVLHDFDNTNASIPTISVTGGTNAVTLSSGNTIQGINIAATGSVNGIVDNGATVGTLTIAGVGITTSAGSGLSLTHGGTVTATATSATGIDGNVIVNHITSATGTALNITNTNIGSGNVTFHDISAGTASAGPVNGIVLNNTGTSGHLTVTGAGSTVTDGTNSSGGTIQNTTGAGISLTNTTNAAYLYEYADPEYGWQRHCGNQRPRLHL